MADIYKVNQGLTVSQKVETLNNFILALEGKYAQGQFTMNEVAQLISDLGINRKFLRDQLIGHTLLDYSTWTHVHAETGYSIWKYSPTNYAYDTLNQIYYDDAIVKNQGLANSEVAINFDNVFLFDGASYVDYTTEAGIEIGVEFNILSDIDEYFYVGYSETYSGIKFNLKDRASGCVLKTEYWNGAAWVELTLELNNYVDSTSSMLSNGLISYDIPGDWASTVVNSVNKYWIRFSTTSRPNQTAKVYYCIPGNSVIGLLSLSSDEFFKEEWKWCTYEDAIYITLRNTGSSPYEGNYYIASSSSVANKQNYFVYNHEIKGDFKDSTYVSIGVEGFSGVSGYSGAGTSGYSGYSGLDGAYSASGISGYSGESGGAGESGVSGTSGYSGKSGADIFSGPDAPPVFQEGDLWWDTDETGGEVAGASGYSGISGYSGSGGDGYWELDTDTLRPISGVRGIELLGLSGDVLTPDVDNIKVFVKIEGVSPNRLTKVIYKDSDGLETVVLTKLD